MSPSQEVDRYLKFVAAVRIGYGILAFGAPRLCPRMFGVTPSDDVRIINLFLGSRDIAIGVHSLMATTPQRRRDAVWVNWACEVVDTLLWTTELARGRRSKMFMGLAIPFNISQHAQWARARRLLDR